MLQKIDPELYKEYIEAKAKIEKNRTEFKENVLKTINKINEILSKYGVNAILDTFEENAINSPGHYCISIKLSKKLAREEFTEFVSEVKKLGFKYNGQWEYCDTIGNYPNLNVNPK